MIHQLRFVLYAIALAGCTEAPQTSSLSSAGMLNGMLNGMQHPEGLTAYLAAQCPLLAQRLLGTGDLTQPFPAELAEELASPACDRFLLYTAELMVPHGQTLELVAGGAPIAWYAGAMGMQHLVAQAYPGYTFAQHGFAPSYPIARKVVTQGYAALTNGIERTVSYRTGVPELDAHRDAGEDAWPREFTQLVPFSPQGIFAMQTDARFLKKLPDFFEPCDPHRTNYDYLTPTCAQSFAVSHCTEDVDDPEEGNCPLPVVVHGNVGLTPDVIPGRSCRILQEGEVPPEGSFVIGDVIVPGEAGCPLIYYAGRQLGVTVYDDRTYNAATLTDDGCDVDAGDPSTLANCDFDVILGDLPVDDARLAYYVYNVKPL